eukprot:9344258-Ditylum_brightwellii.AAC.1
MMTSKTESQAQETSEHSKLSKFKPGKCKLGEQRGRTGNALIDGIQGISIDKGIPKNPVLNPTGAMVETSLPEKGASDDNQGNITQWMTRANTASQAQAVNSTITLPNPISGKRKSDENSDKSGAMGKGQNTGKQGNNTDKENARKAMMK